MIKFFACLMSIALSDLSYTQTPTAVEAPPSSNMRQFFRLNEKPMKSSDIAHIKNVCQISVGARSSCDSKQLKYYQSTDASDTHLYVIDADKPLLLVISSLALESKAPVLFWDFSQYQHSAAEKMDGEGGKLSIGLTLYPKFSENQNFPTVAIIQENHVMYSGGGGQFQAADFLILRNRSDLFERAYTAVPFFCSTMLRACFGEDDPESNPHCHEEHSGILKIQVLPDRKWNFSYSEKIWPPHVSAKHTISIKQAFTRIFHPNKQVGSGGSSDQAQIFPDHVNFCEYLPNPDSYKKYLKKKTPTQ